MEHIDRRAALAVGLVTAATWPAVLAPTPASAQRYRPDEGREIAPGVRRIDLTKRASAIPAYATVSMRDIVYRPGATSENPAMPNDMVCHCLEGELQVSQGPDTPFVAKTGDVWSCMKGMPEADVNTGSTIAAMRVIDLIPRHKARDRVGGATTTEPTVVRPDEAWRHGWRQRKSRTKAERHAYGQPPILSTGWLGHGTVSTGRRGLHADDALRPHHPGSQPELLGPHPEAQAPPHHL